MHVLTELNPDELRLAREFADTLMKFKEYTPGGLLLMLVGKFRDDIGDVLDIEREPLPHRGHERKSLDGLTTVELDTVAGAVGILLDRFAPYMDDPVLPRLLGEFRDALSAQKAERAELRASLAS